MNVITKAMELRRNQGNKKFIIKGINFLLLSLYSIPLVDHVTYHLSKKRLNQRAKQETDIDDILDTLAVNGDGSGCYRGFGKYKQLSLNQGVSNFRELLEELDERNPETIMEIGTHKGGSLYLWVRYFDSADTVISTDIFYRGRKKLYEYFGNISKKHVVCIKGNSQTENVKSMVKKELAGKNIDILFIDGDHSYEGVSTDFEMYSPLVSEGGIIILDDIHRSDEGVCDFWSELNKKHECLEVGTTGNNVSARSPRYGLVMM